MVDYLYNTFLDATKCNTLRAAKEDLEAITPAPMNTMLEKQPRDEAIELTKKRKSVVVQDIPRTVAGISYLLFLGHISEKYTNVCNKPQRYECDPPYENMSYEKWSFG